MIMIMRSKERSMVLDIIIIIVIITIMCFIPFLLLLLLLILFLLLIMGRNPSNIQYMMFFIFLKMN